MSYEAIRPLSKPLHYSRYLLREKVLLVIKNMSDLFLKLEEHSRVMLIGFSRTNVLVQGSSPTVF